MIEVETLVKIPFFYCIKGLFFEDFICKIIILFPIVWGDAMFAGFAMISDFLPRLEYTVFMKYLRVFFRRILQLSLAFRAIACYIIDNTVEMMSNNPFSKGKKDGYLCRKWCYQ